MRFSIFSAFYPFRGGISQFNGRLYRELEKKTDVRAFTFTKQYPDFLFPGKTQFVEKGDIADRIPAERIVFPFNPFSWFRAVRKIKDSEPDILITNFWMTFFGICFGFLAARQNRKVLKIGLIHNLVPHEQKFFDRFFTRFYLKRHDAFIVLSDAVEKDLIQMLPSAPYLKLYHPWYDHFGDQLTRTEACQKIGIHENKINILFFGLIRDYKGLDLLIDAFGDLDEDFQLIIAGEVYGDDQKYLDLIDSSKGKERIHFHNAYISDEEVKYFFSAADCCVLPYRSATQSGIIATSFHFEVPVLATDVGGLKETIESINGGIVIDSAEKAHLLSGIRSLTQNDELVKYRTNIRKAKDLNSWSNFAEEVINFSASLKKN